MKFTFQWKLTKINNFNLITECSYGLSFILFDYWKAWSNNQKIKQRGHEKIKTFGVGRTASADFWKNFIRQLVSSKYLKINIKKYGALQITESGADILKGELEYFYRKISFNTPI